MQAEHRAEFLDGEGYERFMGKWSRAAGRVFLDWLALPAGLTWLDIGCGTAAFTETIHQQCSPAALVGIDPSTAQVSYAQSRHRTDQIEFRVADAQLLPFENASFDVAVSALVLNFIPDREKALVEIKRVAKPEATIAAYVWDFAGRRGSSQHLHAAVARVSGRDTSAAVNAESTTLESLKILFKSAGLEQIETRPIDIEIFFSDFDDYWKSNTEFASPVAQALKSLDPDKQQHIMQMVRDAVPMDERGRISYAARVNAVRGRV